MWFKRFVLLRLPISVLCLVGYATMQRIQSDTVGIDCFSAAINTGLFVFLAVVSIKLVRRRPGALRLAWLLLALELGGAVLLVVSVAYLEGRRVDRVAAFAAASVVLVVWTLPNAFAFYKARSLFTEPAKEMPSL
jgi:hypothetical protein